MSDIKVTLEIDDKRYGFTFHDPSYGRVGADGISTVVANTIMAHQGFSNILPELDNE